MYWVLACQMNQVYDLMLKCFEAWRFTMCKFLIGILIQFNLKASKMFDTIMVCTQIDSISNIQSLMRANFTYSIINVQCI